MSLQKGSTRLANWCWAEYQRGSLNLSSYCLRHLPAHLNQAGREEALHNVLSDFNFLQRKLDLTDARTLIADYEYLPAAGSFAARPFGYPSFRACSGPRQASTGGTIDGPSAG